MTIQYRDDQRIGLLSYKLYSLGWRSGLHQRLPWMQHWLLSLFIYYRQGFADGAEWSQEYRLQRKL